MRNYKQDTITKDDKFQQISLFVDKWMSLISKRNLLQNKIDKKNFYRKTNTKISNKKTSHSNMYFNTYYSQQVNFYTYLGEIQVKSYNFSFKLKMNPLKCINWQKIVSFISKKLIYEYYLAKFQYEKNPRIIMNSEFNSFLISLLPSNIYDLEWKCNCGANSSQNTICNHIIDYWKAIGLKFQNEVNLFLKFRGKNLHNLIEDIHKERSRNFFILQGKLAENLSPVPLLDPKPDLMTFWGINFDDNSISQSKNKMTSDFNLQHQNLNISQNLRDKSRENPIFIYNYEFYSLLAEFYDIFPTIKLEDIQKTYL